MWATTPLIDPKSAAKRDYNKKSLYDHYLEYDLVWSPGVVDIETRIAKTSTYIESGRVQFFEETCKDLKEEITNYKFMEDPDTESGYKDKPIDKRNHSINAFGWICCALPADPSNLMNGVYDGAGNRLDATQTKSDETQLREHALSGVDEVDYMDLMTGSDPEALYDNNLGGW